MCFRDSSRLFMLGKSNYFNSFTTIVCSSKCMLFCLKIDRKIIYDALATTNVPLNELSDLISQCRSLLLNKPDFVVSHIQKQTNRVVYSITRTSLYHQSPHILILYQPLCLC